MAWRPTEWTRTYGKVMTGQVVAVQPLPNESGVYGPRYRWAVMHVGAHIDLAEGFADSVEAASDAADAWVTALAQAALEGAGR